MARPSRAAAASNAALALSVLLLPWYSLGAYEPTGWDATWWARLALACALANLVLLRAGGPRPAAGVLATVALAAVAYRFAWPPDFGFAAGGLSVPTEREIGVWAALAAAAAAAALSRSYGSARSGASP